MTITQRQHQLAAQPSINHNEETAAAESKKTFSHLLGRLLVVLGGIGCALFGRPPHIFLHCLHVLLLQDYMPSNMTPPRAPEKEKNKTRLTYIPKTFQRNFKPSELPSQGWCHLREGEGECVGGGGDTQSLSHSRRENDESEQATGTKSKPRTYPTEHRPLFFFRGMQTTRGRYFSILSLRTRWDHNLPSGLVEIRTARPLDTRVVLRT